MLKVMFDNKAKKKKKKNFINETKVPNARI